MFTIPVSLPDKNIQPPLLELQNVLVMRGVRPVLHDLNLSIHANEHVAIVGPNGCGKSTLIKTITRECYPVTRDGSRMAILGQETWNVFELRNLLGIVSNDTLAFLEADATGLDVVLSVSSAVPTFTPITMSRNHNNNPPAQL
jgi:iron complex transport system ATP-binding protein